MVATQPLSRVEAEYPFEQVISSVEQLREVIGHPVQRVLDKVKPELDTHARRFIERSPFMVLGTSEATGACDVSPRGDGPGFVRVLDAQTLLIPDRPGNKRNDSIRNVLENPHVALIFMIPTIEETLRVNGRARIVADPDLMATMSFRNKQPLLGIAVTVEETYFHCAKAFKRSGLWDAEAWADQSDLPGMAQIMVDQLKLTDTTVEQLSCELEEAYRTRLY